MRYTISLDVHKRETQACIANSAGEVVEEKRFRTSPKSYNRALKKYKDADTIMETVGFYRPVAKWLQELGHEVHLLHTGRMPKARNKSDKRDAKRLLTLWQGDALEEAYLPPDEVQRLRDVARHRMFLGQQSRRLKGKMKHDLYKHGHFVKDNPLETQKGRDWLRSIDSPEIQSELRMFEHLAQELKAIQEKIESVTTTQPVALRLMTMPGIGAYTALLLLGEVGNFQRFPTGDHLAAYAGLTPSRDQSGDHDHHGSITKEGNPILRWALVEAARNHVQHCKQSSITKHFERLAEKRGYSKAITATARQLATVIHSMVVKDHNFRVNP